MINQMDQNKGYFADINITSKLDYVDHASSSTSYYNIFILSKPTFPCARSIIKVWSGKHIDYLWPFCSLILLYYMSWPANGFS